MAKTSSASGDTHPVHALLIRLSELPQVEIRFDFEDQETWAALIEFDEDDNQTSLRYHGGDRYAWVEGAYDDSDEFIEEMSWLTSDEVAALPEGCKLLLKKVRDDEKGIRVGGQFLLQQKG
jgi:hypothetical protein